MTQSGCWRCSKQVVWLWAVALAASSPQLRGAGTPWIHLVSFTTDMYRDHFADSLEAKHMYADHWGYSWHLFDEKSLDCTEFRPVLWRGDYRYCKLAAIKVVWKKVAAERKTSNDERWHYIFWHDIDTHILRPETPLEDFLEAGQHKPVIFTDNALSLNNGVFFLEVSPRGAEFFKVWRSVCRSGQWAWADNGCMYEALLQYLGKDRYTGSCRKFREAEFNEDQPEPPTGNAMMRCFNKEMKTLGMGCCGEGRGVKDMAFLTGMKNSFNHHPCEDLRQNKAFSKKERKLIGKHCFAQGMFMVHSKDVAHAAASLERVQVLTFNGRSREEADDEF